MGIMNIPGKFHEASIIVPRHLIDNLKIAKRGPQDIEIDFLPGNLNSTDPKALRDVVVTDQQGSINIAKELDGKFPDYRRVVPEKASGEPAQFNPELLMRVQKACQLLGDKTFAVSYNGNNPSFSVVRNLVMVIMPWRQEDKLAMVTPDWIQAPLVKEPKKEAA